MFVCVASLYQPVLEISDVKCLCVLFSLSQPSSSVDVKCLCVCVVSLSQHSSRDQGC